jgi:tryptophan-rich sensory protein
LYGLDIAAGARLYRAPKSESRSRALGLWTAEQVLNGAWSPLFFGQHRPRAALVDTGLLLVTLGALENEARKVDRLSTALLAPYVAWTGFALYLNQYIVKHNPRWLLRA